MGTELFLEASSRFSYLCERAQKGTTATAPTKDWNVCSFSCRRQTYFCTSYVHLVNCGPQSDLISIKEKNRLNYGNV